MPNLTAYQETCATVALAQWNHRLALLYGDAKYADVVARALYNGVLSGVSQDDYPIAPDKWCEVGFAPITTTALHLAVKLQQDWAAGVHEWKVAEADAD